MRRRDAHPARADPGVLEPKDDRGIHCPRTTGAGASGRGADHRPDQGLAAVAPTGVDRDAHRRLPARARGRRAGGSRGNSAGAGSSSNDRPSREPRKLPPSIDETLLVPLGELCGKQPPTPKARDRRHDHVQAGVATLAHSEPRPQLAADRVPSRSSPGPRCSAVCAARRGCSRPPPRRCRPPGGGRPLGLDHVGTLAWLGCTRHHYRGDQNRLAWGPIRLRQGHWTALAPAPRETALPPLPLELPRH